MAVELVTEMLVVLAWVVITAQQVAQAVVAQVVLDLLPRIMPADKAELVYKVASQELQHTMVAAADLVVLILAAHQLVQEAWVVVALADQVIRLL
jgi:hypothetical protein